MDQTVVSLLTQLLQQVAQQEELKKRIMSLEEHIKNTNETSEMQTKSTLRPTTSLLNDNVIEEVDTSTNRPSNHVRMPVTSSIEVSTAPTSATSTEPETTTPAPSSAPDSSSPRPSQQQMLVDLVREFRSTRMTKGFAVSKVILENQLKSFLDEKKVNAAVVSRYLRSAIGEVFPPTDRQKRISNFTNDDFERLTGLRFPHFIPDHWKSVMASTVHDGWHLNNGPSLSFQNHKRKRIIHDIERQTALFNQSQDLPILCDDISSFEGTPSSGGTSTDETQPTTPTTSTEFNADPQLTIVPHVTDSLQPIDPTFDKDFPSSSQAHYSDNVECQSAPEPVAEKCQQDHKTELTENYNETDLNSLNWMSPVPMDVFIPKDSVREKMRSYQNKSDTEFGEYKPVTFKDLADPSSLKISILSRFQGKAVNTIFGVFSAFNCVYHRLNDPLCAKLHSLFDKNGFHFEQVFEQWSVIYNEYADFRENEKTNSQMIKAGACMYDSDSFSKLISSALSHHSVVWNSIDENHISHNSLWDLQPLICVHLYNLFVLRNDFRLLKFRNFSQNDNFVCLHDDGSWYIEIHDFKTKKNKSYHISDKLPDHFVSYLEKFLTFRQRFDGDFLFVKKTCCSSWTTGEWGNYIRTDVFGHFLDDVVDGRGESSRELRHIHATSVNADLPDTATIVQRAHKMQHSVQTHLRTYRLSK